MTIQTEKLKLLDKEKILKIQEGIYAYIRTLFVCPLLHSLCIYVFIALKYTCHRNYFS